MLDFIMKYLQVNFTLTDGNGNQITDTVLMQAAKDILCDLSGNAGFESFEENGNGVIGYVQKGLFDSNTLDWCLAEFPIENIKITYETNDAEEKNWNRTWEENGFEPIIINNRCVIHDTSNMPEANTANLIDITIDAEQAFGTGNHETTYMIINELTEICPEGKAVLDCGCGTGILSIAASKLGATNITAYDIDDWSVRNTIHNCELNGVGNINVMLGDASVLNSINGLFDIVIANINRNILISDMPEFRKKMSAGGMLILSGFYDSDADMIIRKGKELGLEFVKKTNRNDWAAIILRSLS